MSPSVVPVVTITSVRPPSIAWPCPTCGDRRPFDCAERFRANTNGKLVDIWSIHRCRVCGATKNLTVVERTPVRRVPRALLDAAERNDAAIARACARDVALLRRNGMTVADGDQWAVAGSALVGSPIRLDFPEPLLVRLDAVLAAVLGVPKRATADLVQVDSPVRIDALRLWSTCVATPAGRGPRRPRGSRADGDHVHPRSPAAG